MGEAFLDVDRSITGRRWVGLDPAHRSCGVQGLADVHPGSGARLTPMEQTTKPHERIVSTLPRRDTV